MLPLFFDSLTSLTSILSFSIIHFLLIMRFLLSVGMTMFLGMPSPLYLTQNHIPFDQAIETLLSSKIRSNHNSNPILIWFKNTSNLCCIHLLQILIGNSLYEPFFIFMHTVFFIHGYLCPETNQP